MSEPSTPISRKHAQLLILHGADLLDNPARKRDGIEIVRRLGYLQLDSINVLERAHHLTLGARWDGYRRPHLKQLVENQRALFEEWTHDACLIPLESEPHWNVRRERFKAGSVANAWWNKRMGTEPVKVQNSVLKRLEREGPLPTSAFREKGRKREAWWGWTPEKTALEYSWRTGLLAVHSRRGFEKVYDLAERVLPAVPKRPSRDETIAWTCHEALKRLGLATTKELAAFWYFFKAAEIEDWCRDNLQRVVFEDKLYWVRDDFQDILSQVKKPPARLRLICPFDPVARDRQRLERFFGFEYRFEAFVPKPKRQFGYYVLPILRGSSFVGRLDAKLHRKESTLEVLGCWWEHREYQSDLNKELKRLARRIGADSVHV